MYYSYQAAFYFIALIFLIAITSRTPSVAKLIVLLCLCHTILWLARNKPVISNKFVNQNNFAVKRYLDSAYPKNNGGKFNTIRLEQLALWDGSNPFQSCWRYFFCCHSQGKQQESIVICAYESERRPPPLPLPQCVRCSADPWPVTTQGQLSIVPFLAAKPSPLSIVGKSAVVWMSKVALNRGKLKVLRCMAEQRTSLTDELNTSACGVNRKICNKICNLLVIKKL